MNRRIYLDNNAATIPDPLVLEAMNQYLDSFCGNPSSIHSFGKECRKVLIRSRDTIADCLNVRSDEVVFTSGGTEGANCIIKGLLERGCSGHIISSSVEHSCVHAPISSFSELGYDTTFLNPGTWGAITADQVLSAVRPDTKLIALMAVNNETGVKTDIEAIAAIALEHNIPFFVDGVALLGKEQFHIPSGVSAMCFSGQKSHSIQGSGFSFIRKNLKLAPLVVGGGQQAGRRAGTENMPGIVALAKAASLIKESLPVIEKKFKKQQEYFESKLLRFLPNAFINGEGPRVGNTSNIAFLGVDGEAVLALLDMEGIAVSHGSACDSGSIEPSRILLNMGLSIDRVNGSIRFSTSRFTTDRDLDHAINTVVRIVKKLQEIR